MTDKELLFKVSGGIKRLRIEKGFRSSERFAECFGLNRVSYHRLESGSNTTLKTLNKILTIHELTFKEFCEQEIR